MWKKNWYIVLKDQALKDFIISAAGSICMFGLLCVFCIFDSSLPVKLQISPCYSLFAVETKAVHVPGSV